MGPIVERSLPAVTLFSCPTVMLTLCFTDSGFKQMTNVHTCLIVEDYITTTVVVSFTVVSVKPV